MSDIDGLRKRMYWVDAFYKGEKIALSLYGYSEEEVIWYLENAGYTGVRAIPSYSMNENYKKRVSSHSDLS